MWAQYTQNNTGACIIIDEYQFVNKNRKILKNNFYKIDNIEYTVNVYNKDITISSNPKTFIKRHYKQIFFRKHIDWEREHERRLFILDFSNIDFLSIKNCVVAICLGSQFKDYDQLDAVLKNPKNECYQQFYTQHLFRQCNIDGKIYCMPYFDWRK